jgi:flagellar biosynthesis protein FlhF
MRTQIFTGATSREVLHKVKEALGDDALILSNRARDGVIEVVALAASDITSTAAAAAPEALEAAQPMRASAPRSVIFPRVDANHEPIAEPQRARIAPTPPAAPAPRALAAAAIPAPRMTAEAAPAAAANATDIDGILSEIQSLKSILRSDIAAFASVESTPAASSRSSVMRELLNAGFSAKLARDLAGDPQAPGAQMQSMEHVAQKLERELLVANEDEIINEGGIYALVGPTGVGKTTTVAKLAARAVVRYGASRVALLTTDSYRIGAHDQLRIYGRILNVPVHAIRDAEDLATVLDELSDRHLVLIDTIGMSQRDRMVAEQAALLSNHGRVKRLLLVSTTANTATLNQVVSAYTNSGVHGCILTKTDEAASLAPALDAVIRHGLPVHYVTDGQRVPEDLQVPSASLLVSEALRPQDEDTLGLEAEEVALYSPAKKPEPQPSPTCEPVFAPEHAMPIHAFPPVRDLEVRVVHG